MMRGPGHTVLGAEVATACSDRYLACIARPVKYVADVAAVAFAFDSHDYSPFLSGKKPTLRLLGFVVINVFPNQDRHLSGCPV
jgi:hypothetical protein